MMIPRTIRPFFASSVLALACSSSDGASTIATSSAGGAPTTGSTGGSASGGTSSSGAGGATGGDAAGDAAAGGTSGGDASDAGGDAAGDAVPEAGADETNDAPIDGDARALPEDSGFEASADAPSSVTDAGTTPFPCLPAGEEKLIVHIDGAPALDITTPDGLRCLSRYLAATDADEALLDFNWNTASAAISVVVRLSDVTPGQTGTFTPFAVAISRGSDFWAGTAGKCHVTVTSSTKLAGAAPPGAYKVVGSVSCDTGWALGKANDVLRQFDFATRVTAPGP